MYVGRYGPSVPTGGTRDRRLRGYLVSFARCPRVETDLAAAVSQFDLNLDQSILYVPCSIRAIYFPLSVDLTDSDRVAAA